jgi:PIN domain nuclease of toxin-antitoxin system
VRLLLDTHVLLWATLKPELLPPQLQSQLLNPEHTLILSAATAWELSIKHHLGKLPEAEPLLAFTDVARQLGAEVLSISAAHAVQAGVLDWTHRDPFDRMLVAQALQEGCRLVTLDEHIRMFAPAPLYDWT